MIRIKEININGIRGFNFLKDGDGNSLPHRIELNKGHLKYNDVPSKRD
jgi:hypothetical protein